MSFKGEMKENINLNSLLLAVAIAVSGWVGYETVQNGKDVAVTKAWMSTLTTQIGSLVNRQEFDIRIQMINTKLLEIEVEVTKMKNRPQQARQ